MGRPKGAQNKLSKSVKEVLSLAADELGGVDRVVAWVKEDPANERVFWSQMYTKLISASGREDDPIHTQTKLTGLGPVYGLHPPPEA